MLVPFLLEAARESPNKLIVSDPTYQLTFAQLASMAKVIRRIILKNTRCQRVGIMLPTSASGLSTVFGALWARKTFVPLNFLLPPAELAAVIADAQIDLVISTIHFEKLLSQVPVKTLYLQKLGMKRRYLWSKLQPTPEPPDVKPDDLAAIVYTSGTSGEPKGVCLTHNNFLSNARGIIDHLRITPDHRLLGVLPIFHVFGLTILTFVPVIRQVAMTCIPRFSAAQACRAISAGKVDIILAIPSMYAAMARLKNLDKSSFVHVKIAASGAEPLGRKVYDEIYERMGIRLIEGYGLTETSPVISADLPWAHKVGTVGPPIAGVEIKLCDEQQNVLSPDAEGELYVRGPMVMTGYYNRPSATAEVIDADGWFRTGDVVRIDSDGYIKITGRAKDLIIVGGENVYPREIEVVLEEHEAVAESAVIGLSDELRGEVVVGFVTLKEGAETNGNDLREFCRDRLAGYKIPRQIFIHADLPRGPTGKILKRKLKECLPE